MAFTVAMVVILTLRILGGGHGGTKIRMRWSCSGPELGQTIALVRCCIGQWSHASLPRSIGSWQSGCFEVKE